MNGLFETVEAVLEYIDGNTGLTYRNAGGFVAEPLDDPTTETPRYLWRMELESDHYNSQRKNPTALLFDVVTLMLRAEVEPIVMSSDDGDVVTPARMQEFRLVEGSNGISTMTAIFNAKTYSENVSWNRSRTFYFRNENLRCVD